MSRVMPWRRPTAFRLHAAVVMRPVLITMAPSPASRPPPRHRTASPRIRRHILPSRPAGATRGHPRQADAATADRPIPPSLSRAILPCRARLGPQVGAVWLAHESAAQLKRPTKGGGHSGTPRLPRVLGTQAESSGFCSLAPLLFAKPQGRVFKGRLGPRLLQLPVIRTILVSRG